MRALFACVGLGCIAALGFFACNPNSIGRPCVNPENFAVKGTQVSSPALECPSRLCLIQPSAVNTGQTGIADGGFRATCTASCNTNDDCKPETTDYCKAGFACAVATEVDTFCCRKVCVCRDDLVEGKNVDI